MTELKVIGLVEEYRVLDESKNNWINHVQLKEEFNWFLTPEFDKLREGFQPVDNREFMDGKRKKQTAANKEKSTPYSHDNKNDLTEAQVNEFLSISQEVAKEQENDYSVMEEDRGTFGGAVLKQRLVETGKFDQEQAAQAIEVMIQRGKIK